MEKYGLEFTRERLLEGLSSFGLMAIGSITGLLVARIYGFGAVFLGSLVVSLVIFLVVFPRVLRRRNKIESKNPRL